MNLFCSNGCVYAVPRQASGGGYALAGLKSAPPIILQGVSMSDTDIVLPVSTLSGRRFLYEFGKAIGQGQMSGIALLGCGGVSSFSRMVDNMRVSSGKGKVTLSTPLGGYRVFVTGFGMAPPDAEYNLQPFSILFNIAS